MGRYSRAAQTNIQGLKYFKGIWERTSSLLLNCRWDKLSALTGNEILGHRLKGFWTPNVNLPM